MATTLGPAGGTTVAAPYSLPEQVGTIATPITYLPEFPVKMDTDGSVVVDVSRGAGAGRYVEANLDAVIKKYKIARDAQMTAANTALSRTFQTKRKVNANIAEAQEAYVKAQKAKAKYSTFTNEYKTAKADSNAAAARIRALGGVPNSGNTQRERRRYGVKAFGQRVSNFASRLAGTMGASNAAKAKKQVDAAVLEKKRLCGWTLGGRVAPWRHRSECGRTTADITKQVIEKLDAEAAAAKAAEGNSAAGGSRKRRMNKNSKKTRRH